MLPLFSDFMSSRANNIFCIPVFCPSVGLGQGLSENFRSICPYFHPSIQCSVQILFYSDVLLYNLFFSISECNCSSTPGNLDDCSLICGYLASCTLEGTQYETLALSSSSCPKKCIPKWCTTEKVVGQTRTFHRKTDSLEILDIICSST